VLNAAQKEAPLLLLLGDGSEWFCKVVRDGNVCTDSPYHLKKHCEKAATFHRGFQVATHPLNTLWDCDWWHSR
jgi:hypothetical protein